MSAPSPQDEPRPRRAGADVPVARTAEPFGCRPRFADYCFADPYPYAGIPRPSTPFGRGLICDFETSRCTQLPHTNLLDMHARHPLRIYAPLSKTVRGTRNA